MIVKNKLIKRYVMDLFGRYVKGFIWNPSNCKGECDKSCNVGEYLNYSDCKCRKKLTDKLIDECSETIEQTKLFNTTFT